MNYCRNIKRYLCEFRKLYKGYKKFFKDVLNSSSSYKLEDIEKRYRSSLKWYLVDHPLYIGKTWKGIKDGMNVIVYREFDYPLLFDTRSYPVIKRMIVHITTDTMN
jgi:hypothetical protein